MHKQKNTQNQKHNIQTKKKKKNPSVHLSQMAVVFCPGKEQMQCLTFRMRTILIKRQKTGPLLKMYMIKQQLPDEEQRHLKTRSKFATET